MDNFEQVRELKERVNNGLVDRRKILHLGRTVKVNGQILFVSRKHRFHVTSKRLSKIFEANGRVIYTQQEQQKSQKTEILMNTNNYELQEASSKVFMSDLQKAIRLT